MKTSPLHPRYGLRIDELDLRCVTAGSGYPGIRKAFENSSLLYFANQFISDKEHLRLGALFGPREDRSLDSNRTLPAISLVTNVKNDAQLYSEEEKHLLDLKSNMLWHTDSTFLPTPALANILIGRVIPPSGSTTQFASTRIAWEEMPTELKTKASDIYFRHDYTHSRRQVDPDLAMAEKFTHWGEQIWKSVWKNPHNGKEALYIASHACGVVGMESKSALRLIGDLIDWVTQEKYVYTHHWQKDDVLIWDERAVLHRGRPWNYREARTLSSICISATKADGLDSVRYDASVTSVSHERFGLRIEA